MANLSFPNLVNGLIQTLGDELNARFNAIKAAVNALPTFRGLWNNARAYVENDLVLDSGSAWICLIANTNAQPVEGLTWTTFAHKGDAGAPGTNGLDGKNGATLRSGSATPDNAIGADGDYYLNLTTGDLFQRAGGVYSASGNLKGPQGLQGLQGLAGNDGGIVSTLARVNTNYTTASLANGASETGTIALGRIALLIRMATNAPARVRFYRTAAQRDADLMRPIGTAPVGSIGLIFEGVTTVGTLAIDSERNPMAVNGEAIPTSNIFISVTNLSGATAVITVTVNSSTIQS